ncbi:MAG: FAD-dependent oxidoreductase [Coriobacteriia bacterium]
MEPISRRDFVKGALAASAGVGVAGIVAGCSPKSTGDAAGDTTTKPSDSGLPWLGKEPDIADADVESEIMADVVVVGCGLAGVAAARAAGEEGAKVVAFEKAEGPQCRSGDFALVNGKLQARWGRDVYDPDMIADHEMDEMSYIPKRAILSKWAKNNAEVFDWYIAAKPDLLICESSLSDVPDDTPALAPCNYPLPEKYDWTKEAHPCIPSSVMFQPSQEPVFLANMEKAVSESGVKPYYGHFVEKLIMDGGRCVGCYARNAKTGKYVKATASKGVVLATGEYSSNPDMVEYYCPAVKQNGVPTMFPNVDVEGKPTNTGDGLKLGAWIGAAIQQHHAPMIHWMGANNGAQTPMGAMGTAPWLQLNKDGKRFMNEDIPGQQLENQIELQRDRTIYQIWDSGWKDQIPNFPAAHGNVCYIVDTPPKNNGSIGYMNQAKLDEAVKNNACVKADTLEALFDALKDIDKEAALKSVERYNTLARNGKDEDFGKVPSRMFPLDKPPFYAAKGGIAPMLVCLGGLESDEDCHVYDTSRKVIPGLYVAGNVQGNRYAVQYPIALKGVSHSLCLYYGYVAGKNAAAEV